MTGFHFIYLIPNNLIRKMIQRCFWSFPKLSFHPIWPMTYWHLFCSKLFCIKQWVKASKNIHITHQTQEKESNVKTKHCCLFNMFKLEELDALSILLLSLRINAIIVVILSKKKKVYFLLLLFCNLFTRKYDKSVFLIIKSDWKESIYKNALSVRLSAL